MKISKNQRRELIAKGFWVGPQFRVEAVKELNAKHEREIAELKSRVEEIDELNSQIAELQQLLGNSK